MKYNERWASGVIIPPILPASIPMDPSRRRRGPPRPFSSTFRPLLPSPSRFAHYEQGPMLLLLHGATQIIASWNYVVTRNDRALHLAPLSLSLSRRVLFSPIKVDQLRSSREKKREKEGERERPPVRRSRAIVFSRARCIGNRSVKEVMSLDMISIPNWH